MDKKKITSEDFVEERERSDEQKREEKNTKKKSAAQKAIPALIVTIVSLLIILTCVLIAYYQVYNSSKQNANILEGVYTSSYYSMVDNVNNLAVDVSKYSTQTTRQAKLNTLHDMMTDCNYILAGLSTLPIDEENVSSATKFFNQVNGLCEAYTKVLNKGETLTQEQELVFDEIALVLGEIKENFNKQNAGMNDDNFNFVNASVFDDAGMNELSSGLGDLTSETIDYPAMIFDGPFSTALETTEVKGLPASEVSTDQAYDYLRNNVYKNRDKVSIEYDRETNGDISTYDFNVTIGKKFFYAQVSKHGGLLLTLSGYAETGEPIMSGESATELAKTFANNIGFESMDSVWLEIHDNVAYVNLAPVIDGVIMYPDLVKVKVDLTSQEIIGFEAVNYALNHVDRTPVYNVSEAKAEELLGFDYNILKTSKTVIRLDSGKEISAYEFMSGVLKQQLSVNTLIIGYDHHFGHGRKEGFPDYVRYGQMLGIDVIQAKGLTLGDVAVSSSVTRAFLSEGEVEMASRCLARPYALSGHVVSGFQEGRGMGFPTANIIVDNVQKLIPARGAYAVRVTDESASGMRYVGMLNIGLRPTMKEKVEKETIEVHLLGYNGDLYGHLLKVEFIERLREEHKFRSKAELIRQLQADEARVESMRHKILED